MSMPVTLTDEEREALLRAAAQLTAAVQQYAAALLPAARAAADQIRQLSDALRAAGYTDEHGQPIHQGGSAEDCPACARYVHNITYPFLCPGPEQP